MRIETLRTGQVLLLSLALSGISRADVDWSMMLSPQFTEALTPGLIDFQITFINNSTQDIFFSDFGDGQGITVDLAGDVLGNGQCGPGVDCFVQSLFLTSPDPIDIPAGSTGTTFHLGALFAAAHNTGDQIEVIAKGGPDSINGVFPNPAFSETTATVDFVPEPSSIALFMTCLVWWRSSAVGAVGRRDAGS